MSKALKALMEDIKLQRMKCKNVKNFTWKQVKLS